MAYGRRSGGSIGHLGPPEASLEPGDRHSAVAFLLLVALLLVLALSRELPLTDDTIGVHRLFLRTRWATASVLLRHVGVLPAISARQLVAADPWLESEEATAAAVWLASNGRPAERLHWASALTVKRPDFVQLLGPAIDAALRFDGVDCEVTRQVHRVVNRLPAGTRQRPILQRKVRSLASSVGRQPVQSRTRTSQPQRVRPRPCRLS